MTHRDKLSASAQTPEKTHRKIKSRTESTSTTTTDTDTTAIPSSTPTTPNTISAPQSRRQKRKGIPPSATIIPSLSTTSNFSDGNPNSSSGTFTITRSPNPEPYLNLQLQLESLPNPLNLNLPSPPNMSTRLLLISLGNPAPYLSTLHSAGHLVLQSLQRTLSDSLPPFQKSRLHGNGLLSSSFSSSLPLTLYQCPTYMNVSGPGVSSCWKAFCSAQGGDAENKLLIIHDDLEIPLGNIRVRPGSASPQGHNGLKSIRTSMQNQKMGASQHLRIGIGIGRPESRDAKVVADYVLRNMSGRERSAIEGCVGKVVMELGRIGGF